MKDKDWFERNGDDFDTYFEKKLTVHTARAAGGELLGFAISGIDSTSEVFLYELHVSEEYRTHGIGIELLAAASSTIDRPNVTIELNVHRDNKDAIRFYERRGFGKDLEKTRELNLGTMLVMRREL